MKKKLFYLFFLITNVLIIGCLEEKHSPVELDSGPIEPVENIQIAPTPGGGTISYTLPDSKSLLYVLAEVTYPNGEVKEFVSSKYTTNIEVIGLPEVGEYKVKLYAVSKSNAKSTAVETTFTCLKPPYQKVFESLSLGADFGGVNIKWNNNDTEARLGVVLLYNDSIGDFVQYGSEYSTGKVLSHSFRGMESVENRFGVFVRDRFGNVSDTLYANIKPLFEVLIPKTKFKEVILPGDSPIWPGLSYVQWHFLWDNVIIDNYDNPYSSSYYTRYFVTSNPAALPQHITVDLGTQYILSRFRLNNYYRFHERNPKKYEIWGHPGPPPADGSWNGWVKLGEHEQFKPSGGSGTTPATEADKRYWLDGDMVNLQTDVGPIRYIRLKVLSNWAGNANFALHEITFWGSN